MIKRYKDGKFFDVPEEEAEKIKKRFEKRRAPRQRTSADYEAKIKTLEETLEKVLAQLEEKEVPDETE